MKQYIVSVITAALICGILTGIMNECGVKQLLKLLCGLFLTFTVLQPIAHFTVPEIPDLEEFSAEAEKASMEGKRITEDAFTRIITDQAEAYILDKAKTMEVFLTAEVATSSEDGLPVPKSVVLEGDVSMEARQKLSQIIADELGIPKENQVWTGGKLQEK